jgi:hypothetical protein
MTKSILRFTHLIVFIFASTFLVKAQNFDNIAAAIRTANTSSLASNFEANVEITIKNDGRSYSKSQAEMVLKNFFTTNAPKSFNIVHTGNSPDGSKYFIGTLVTNTGTFRTYVLVKKVNTATIVQEIRFEGQ